MAKVFSEKQIHKIGRIDQVIRDFFEANPSIIEIPAKELMPVFIQKGIFYKNHRDGLPIRNLLRDLDKENKLSLLKHTKVIRHSANRKWYFAKQ
jgi:hypothetical protein